VLKQQLLSGHDFGDTELQMVQREAVIMEELSASPRITNIYGHCGTSVLVETLPRPFRTEKMKLLSIIDRLDVAITLAESIADMHGFEDGMIINNDVCLLQYLYATDGSLKLNDFNLASIPDWDHERGAYCKVKHEPWERKVSLFVACCVRAILRCSA
jgi:hypothetical protein